MGDKSKIAWTDATWNPVVGCTKISEGCQNCYAERDHTKRHKAFQEGKLQNVPQYRAPFSMVQMFEDRLTLPLKWKRPRKIFVNSYSDLFHPAVEFEFIAEVFKVMSKAQRHTFQVLTKRPGRMWEFFQWAEFHEYDFAFALPTNIWLGFTAENQERFDERIVYLYELYARYNCVIFISGEPMLGPINMHLSDSQEDKLYRRTHGGSYYRPFIALVICGGESGPKARPMHPDWARSLRDQCVAAGVKFYFKQWGEWCFPEQFMANYKNHENNPWKVGTKKAGHLLDGQEWKQLPEVNQ